MHTYNFKLAYANRVPHFDSSVSRGKQGTATMSNEGANENNAEHDVSP